MDPHASALARIASGRYDPRPAAQASPGAPGDEGMTPPVLPGPVYAEFPVEAPTPEVERRLLWSNLQTLNRAGTPTAINYAGQAKLRASGAAGVATVAVHNARGFNRHSTTQVPV